MSDEIGLVECSPCNLCGTWVVLRLAEYNSELEMYEFTCPRCEISTGTAQRKIWRLPRSVEQNGHFTLDEYEQFSQKPRVIPPQLRARTSLVQ